MRPKKDCLVEYVMEKAFGDINVTAVRNHVEGLYPDSDNFERGLVRAAKQGVDELKNLIQWLNKVVDADGVLTNDEFDWLLEATDILNR